MIVYNRNGHLDRLFRLYGLLGDDPITQAKRKMHNIQIVTSLDELKNNSDERAKTWLQRVGGDAAEEKQQLR